MSFDLWVLADYKKGKFKGEKYGPASGDNLVYMHG